MARRMELDRFDRQLLNLLQEDAARTAEQLAEKIGLSASAIQRRIRKLREQGVIVRETAILDSKQVGSPTVFVVGIQVDRERPEVLARFREWLANEPKVQQAFYVTGEVDFVLIVTAASTEQYDAYMARMLQQHPNIKRYTTNVALSVVKRGLTIPVATG